jgi:tRNA(fMet)-specific endonuclease VapC
VKYLLDTDHISFLQNRRGPEYVALSARLARYSSADFAFSIVSFHEQMVGGHALLNRARSTAQLIHGYTLLMEMLQSFTSIPVLPFDAAAAAVFDGLQAQRIRVGTMDLRIAALALSRSLVVLTRNLRDFSRVPGLITEDWTI